MKRHYVNREGRAGLHGRNRHQCTATMVSRSFSRYRCPSAGQNPAKGDGHGKGETGAGVQRINLLKSVRTRVLRVVAFMPLSLHLISACRTTMSPASISCSIERGLEGIRSGPASLQVEKNASISGISPLEYPKDSLNMRLKWRQVPCGLKKRS